MLMLKLRNAGFGFLLTALLWAAADRSYAASVFCTPASGYQANDIVTTEFIDSYDVSAGVVYAWADGTLNVYNKDGSVSQALGVPADSYTASSNVYNSFVKVDPSGGSVWVGFTSNDGSGDDRIYQVDLGSQSWSQKATLIGNYDLDFYGGNSFVSATNSTTFGAPNGIWLLDTSGANSHDQIADIGGYSAGLGIDSVGNLFYATTGLVDGQFNADNKLISYSAAQVNSAMGALSLSLADAAVLADIAVGGGGDSEVGAADNVIFTANDYTTGTSYAAIWDGSTGYNQLANGTGALGNWFTLIASEGDITAGGDCYLLDGAASWVEDPPDSGNWVQTRAYYGIAEISVPEPTSLALVGLGIAALRNRKRKGFEVAKP